MKRFYKLVTTEADQHGTYAIHLDGRPVKTPARQILAATNHAIATAIMQEWDAQEEEILPGTMPLTQIASTAIDKTPQERPVMEAQILKYFDTDLLCYRTEYPEAVGQAQAAQWDSVIKDFEEHFGVTIKTTTKLQALIQSSDAHTAVKNYIQTLNNNEFTILQLVTPLAGSVMSGILFTLGKLSPAQIMDIARVEERWKDGIYNAAKYGQDPLTEKADASMLQDLTAAADYLKMLD